MPDLTFFYDNSFDYGAHMDELLKSVETDNEPDNRSSTEE
jgi:ribosome-binding factor A